MAAPTEPISSAPHNRSKAPRRSRRLVLTTLGAFVLKETNDGATRLISRVRGGWQPRFATDISTRLVLEPTAFLMERRMLLGIKERAERAGERQNRLRGAGTHCADRQGFGLPPASPGTFWGAQS